MTTVWFIKGERFEGTLTLIEFNRLIETAAAERIERDGIVYRVTPNELIIEA